uniref:Protein VACUOLELESS1 n=1 Tax=Ananas comosus var. bracteatus TaxID=296719 RepID=A0A6V7NYX9_ANACO|nr:unnamed protein product [Ananas comosus var. bracteatus]
MSSVSVAAEWEQLHDRFYRKPELYGLQWGGARMDLARHRVACAPFGGPVAAIRDDSKIVQLFAESARRKLLIFSSSGHPLASAAWDRPGGRLVGMAWSDDLLLHCLVQDGSLYCYNIRAELVGPPVSLGKECFEQGVAECVFWGNGVVAITESNQIFCVPDFKNPRPCKLADPGSTSSRCASPSSSPSTRCPAPWRCSWGSGITCSPWRRTGCSSSGRDRAAAEDGRLAERQVPGDVHARRAASRHPHRFLQDHIRVHLRALPPEQIAWCGLDSVLLYWDEMLLMVGPHGEPVCYYYDEPIKLIPECDGVRILSNSSMEFLQRVPDSTVSIFGIGSMSPAALLYDALDHFDKRSAKADENLRLIHSSLPEAIEACIDAAGHEFDISRQRTLLRAASYGRAFCSQFPRERFQEMCKVLRVLNAVRNHEIGTPLSIQQYKMLTAPVLIGRLINANQHLLALRISEYLNLNPEVVIMHWACEKITASPAIPDAVLLEQLLDKLKLCKGISYAAIAAHADNSGRRKLAAMLVNHELQPSKQVPLLLSIGEEDTALVKATESGDTDLVYLVLFHIWQTKPALDFFGTINARPLARDLFVTYARSYKHEFLKDFFLSTGRLQDVAFLLLKESWEFEKNPMASRGSPLHGPRIRLIEQAQKLFSETKEHNFEAKAAEEQAKLLRLQHELEVSTKQAIFMDSSISDTIRTCIVLGNHRAAMKVKTEFKVSEKRWYWLKAFALATVRDWEGLEKFSKEKRPQVPFVEACIEADEKAEALKYIPKLAEPRERSEAYARIGMAKEAADAASQDKDSELFGRLKQTLAQNTATSSIFDTLRDRLSFQGVY